jgi:ribonuclease VapC
VIVVDTSALIAVLLKEAQWEACKETLEGEADLLVSAGTLAEALIVAERRGLTAAMSILLGEIDFQIVPVTEASARRAAAAYATWGKGVHPAGLNFGDCFAYETAKSHDCALLFIGDDFAQTDIGSALA